MRRISYVMLGVCLIAAKRSAVLPSPFMELKKLFRNCDLVHKEEPSNSSPGPFGKDLVDSTISYRCGDIGLQHYIKTYKNEETSNITTIYFLIRDKDLKEVRQTLDNFLKVHDCKKTGDGLVRPKGTSPIYTCNTFELSETTSSSTKTDSDRKNIEIMIHPLSVTGDGK